MTARSRHRRAGITIHRATLHPRDRTRQLGLPVTSPARTVLDLTPTTTGKALSRAVNDLLRQGYLNPVRPDRVARPLPPPSRRRAAAELHGFEVDAYFPAERVVVELDGWDFHSSRQSFISDRDRDAALLALGIVTVRITWDRLIETPEREAGLLKRILEQRRSS